MFAVSQHICANVRESNSGSSPSPPPLPPPLVIESMNEETESPTYEAHVSIPSYLKRPSKRVSTAAELAYLYETKEDSEFVLPFQSHVAGVEFNSTFYDDPKSLSLTPAPRRNRSEEIAHL